MSSVGARIKKRRTEIGISASDLAKRLSINPSTVTRYETGEIKAFRAETILALSKILQCSPSYLMGFEDADDVPFSPLAKKIAKAFDFATPKDQAVICTILSVTPEESKPVLIAAKGGGIKQMERDAKTLESVSKKLRSINPQK